MKINPHLRTTHAYIDTTVNLVNNQRNQVFSNRGATTDTIFNLPTGVAPGDRFIFLVEEDGQTLKVNATSNSRIRSGTIVGDVNGYTQSSTRGSLIQLVAIDTTNWIMQRSLGNWIMSS